MKRIGIASVVAVVVSLLVGVRLAAPRGSTRLDPGRIPARPFQKLWIPPLLEGTEFDLTVAKSSKSFWEGATTATYSFNKLGFWGPTVVLNRGDQVKIKVKNELDEPTTCHWHGLHLPAAMDGGPHQVIPPGGSWTASFKVDNNAATYWYHPHAHETTQKQLTYGAGGLILIRDKEEAALPLPRRHGVDDIPLVLTSRRFYRDDQFSFEGDDDKYGDYLLVNGTLDPAIGLPARFVRLRILNAEIERGYELGFGDDREFLLIATDGGLVDRPIPLKRLKLMVGERVEILVDLGADAPGAKVDLMAYNAGQSFGFPGGERGRGRPNGSLLNDLDFRVLRINVEPSSGPGITKAPEKLASNRFGTEAEVTNRRTIRVTGGRPGTPFSFDDKLYEMHRVNQVVKLGAVEKWTIVNNNIFGHSFHIHDVQFKIVERSDGPVPAYEQGWKDTLYLPRARSVSFIARFADHADDSNPFMYHCHMANHEDGGLMGEFLVVEDTKGLDVGSGIKFRDPTEHPVTAAMKIAASRRENTRAADFKATDLDGKALSLASLTSEKPLLMFYIEYLCPCSRDAAPFFDRLREKYGDRCNVVGVINTDAKLARAWAEQVGVKFPIIADPDQKLIKASGVERSVDSLLIAPGGRIARATAGYNVDVINDLSEAIARLAKVPVERIPLADAPSKLTTGCLFPSP